MKNLFLFFVLFSLILIGPSLAFSFESKIEKFFGVKKPIMAVVDIDPSPGKANHPGMKTIIKNAIDQMLMLERAGVDGVLFENSDQPSDVLAPKEVVAMMSVVVYEAVKKATKIKVGVEFLDHDPIASLAIAKASGAQFIRTDFFVDKMKNSDGIMKIDPKGYLEYRKKIGAENVLIMTDVQVKYAKMLNPKKTLKQSTLEAIKMSSDGIVVTGRKNGHPPSVVKLREVFQAQKGSGFGVIQGSGFSYKNAPSRLPFLHGVIVGTSIMDSKRNIIEAKAKQLMEVVHQFRAKL